MHLQMEFGMQILVPSKKDFQAAALGVFTHPPNFPPVSDNLKR